MQVPNTHLDEWTKRVNTPRPLLRKRANDVESQISPFMIQVVKPWEPPAPDTDAHFLTMAKTVDWNRRVDELFPQTPSFSSQLSDHLSNTMFSTVRPPTWGGPHAVALSTACEPCPPLCNLYGHHLLETCNKPVEFLYANQHREIFLHGRGIVAGDCSCPSCKWPTADELDNSPS